MTKTKKVLFLCTDNFTRSITAEMCLKDYLNRESITSLEVSSAGFNANSDITKYLTTHFDRMKQLGVDISKFKRTQFSEDLFLCNDLIIGMDQDHKYLIQKKYNKEIPLFSEICNDNKYKIINMNPENNNELNALLEQMVDYFYEVMPTFVERLNKSY